MSQTERILYLDQCIRMNGSVTVKQVAEKFEVSERQVKRDIEYMRDRFNAPVVYVRSPRGYRYESKFNDLEFTNQHFVLFYVILKSLTSNQQFFPLQADDMLMELQNAVPKDFRQVSNHVSYQLPAASLIKPEYFMAVCDAVRLRLCLDISYRDVEKAVTKRRIEPEQIINYNGAWYIVSYDYLKKDFRTFHISRIEAMEVTDQPFDSHKTGYPNMQFKSYADELSAYLNSGFGIFHGGKLKRVKIEFTGKASRIVENQVWHPKQKLVVNEAAETAELSFPVSELTEVLSKLLSFGSLAKPVEPPELVDLWRNEIKKMAAL